MRALRETQQWLASLILEPERLDDQGQSAAEIERRIAIDDRDTALARLRAYVNGYPARLREALAEAYPAVEHIVGAQAFAELAARYRPHVPAGVYNLSDVGASLPEALIDDELAARLPFLPDLARLERCVHRAFHAHVGAPLDTTLVVGWTLEDWDAAVLEFQPGVTVVRSPWPVRDLWQARATPVERIDIEVEGRPQSVLIHRAGFQVVCELVDDAQAAVLDALLEGKSLGAALATIEANGGDPEAVARWFAAWTGRELVAACKSHEPAPVGS